MPNNLKESLPFISYLPFTPQSITSGSRNSWDDINEEVIRELVKDDPRSALARIQQTEDTKKRHSLLFVFYNELSRIDLDTAVEMLPTEMSMDQQLSFAVPLAGRFIESGRFQEAVNFINATFPGEARVNAVNSAVQALPASSTNIRDAVEFWDSLGPGKAKEANVDSIVNLLNQVDPMESIRWIEDLTYLFADA